MELATCLPANIHIFAHAAIAGKTMAQFRIHLNDTMHHGSEVGVLQGLRNFISGLPSCGHGWPDPESVRAISWTPYLERHNNL